MKDMRRWSEGRMGSISSSPLERDIKVGKIYYCLDIQVQDEGKSIEF